MWPMWRDYAQPRLTALGLGLDRAAHTLRLTGIGESALVALIGDELLRADNPQVATYARADAVDVVVSATGSGTQSAAEIVERTLTTVRDRVGEYVFAEGNQSWADALAARLGGRTVAIVEAGTAGQLEALIGAADFLIHGELMRGPLGDLEAVASEARAAHGADLGLAVEATERGGDTHVEIAVATPGAVEHVERLAFLGGDAGRRRAAIAASGALWHVAGTLPEREASPAAEPDPPDPA
jgi:nicotinamide-nucleotide amidase